MAAVNHTEFLHLPIWEKGNVTDWFELNGAFTTIDSFAKKISKPKITLTQTVNLSNDNFSLSVEVLSNGCKIVKDLIISTNVTTTGTLGSVNIPAILAPVVTVNWSVVMGRDMIFFITINSTELALFISSGNIATRNQYFRFMYW